MSIENFLKIEECIEKLKEYAHKHYGVEMKFDGSEIVKIGSNQLLEISLIKPESSGQKSSVTFWAPAAKYTGVVDRENGEVLYLKKKSCCNINDFYDRYHKIERQRRKSERKQRKEQSTS